MAKLVTIEAGTKEELNEIIENHSRKGFEVISARTKTVDVKLGFFQRLWNGEEYTQKTVFVCQLQKIPFTVETQYLKLDSFLEEKAKSVKLPIPGKGVCVTMEPNHAISISGHCF